MLVIGQFFRRAGRTGSTAGETPAATPQHRSLEIFLGATASLWLISARAEVDQAHHWYSFAAVLPGGHQNFVAGAPRERQRGHHVDSHFGRRGLLDHYFRLAPQTDVDLRFWP